MVVKLHSVAYDASEMRTMRLFHVAMVCEKIRKRRALMRHVFTFSSLRESLRTKMTVLVIFGGFKYSQFFLVCYVNNLDLAVYACC